MQVVFPEPKTTRAEIVLHPPGPQIAPEDYVAALRAANPELRIERLSSGDIRIAAPEALRENKEIWHQFADWVRRDGSGAAADSATVYHLQNGSTRSSYASWIAKDRLASGSDIEKPAVLSLCPDFVIEVCPNTDDMQALRPKMCEWIEQGAQLGWLIDPAAQTVEIYRPTLAVETLHAPPLVEAGPPVKGFALDLTKVWSANA